MEIDIAFAAEARVGEGPTWDAGNGDGTLHWVDILAGRVHTSDPSTGRSSTIETGTLVGAALPRRAGGFVAATSFGFAKLDAGGSFRDELRILPDGIRMNDAKCDRAGRLWAGSTEMDFASGRGALHALAPDWSTEVILDGLTLPNGLDWSPDDSVLYLADTIERVVLAFDFDLEDPGISGSRTLIEFGHADGLPDGLTVDADGCLWIAMWEGGRIVRVSPDGEVLAEIAVPVHQPTSCAFGGPDLDVLYVTTAREGLEVGAGDPAGSVLAVTGLGVQGRQPTFFAG